MSKKKEEIFVFGAGGHAKVVIDIIEKQDDYSIAFLFDDDPALKGRTIYGYKVNGDSSDLVEVCRSMGISKGIVAIGNNKARLGIAEKLEQDGFFLITAIHPSSIIGRGATIGIGSVVMAGVVVNSDTKIGENVIINTKASVDHDCQIDDGVHIAPGATICGEVNVGTGTFVGAGAVIIHCCSVGKVVMIGSGSVVIADVPDGVKVVGVPAKIMER